MPGWYTVSMWACSMKCLRPVPCKVPITMSAPVPAVVLRRSVLKPRACSRCSVKAAMRARPAASELPDSISTISRRLSMTAGWAFSAAAFRAVSGAAATPMEPAARHRAVSQRAGWVKRIGMKNLLSEAKEVKKFDQQKKPCGHMEQGYTALQRLQAASSTHISTFTPAPVAMCSGGRGVQPARLPIQHGFFASGQVRACPEIPQRHHESQSRSGPAANSSHAPELRAKARNVSRHMKAKSAMTQQLLPQGPPRFHQKIDEAHVEGNLSWRHRQNRQANAGQMQSHQRRQTIRRSHLRLSQKLVSQKISGDLSRNSQDHTAVGRQGTRIDTAHEQAMRTRLQWDGLRAADQNVIEKRLNLSDQAMKTAIRIRVAVVLQCFRTTPTRAQVSAQLCRETAKQNIDRLQRGLPDLQEVLQNGFVAVDDLQKQVIGHLSSLCSLSVIASQAPGK